MSTNVADDDNAGHKNGKSEFDPTNALAFLIKQFVVERYFYLGASFVSLLLLGYLILNLIKNKEYGQIAIMLGPTGLITFSLTRVLKMWTDCIEFLKVYLSKS